MIPRPALGALSVLVACTLALPDDSWARGRSGGRGSASAGSSHRHSHRSYPHRPVGAFFFWGPWYRPYYGYEPFPYTPYAVQPSAPVYVEQYPGEPTPGTTDVIYCPNRNAYYPDATDCPGGWQRVIAGE